MGLIIPIILIISSLGIFFGYVDPNYKAAAPANTDYTTWSINALGGELQNYQDIANNSQKVVEKRNTLIDKKNSIAQDSQNKLAVLLPRNIDNIRLIIEVNNIAAKRGLALKNISFSEQNANSPQASANNNQSYGTLSLKFTVNATYGNFLQFLTDLETNLRLIDITNIGFTSTDSGIYDFNVGLNTYWLK
jgi:Tfp pilus assembly protein PilO